LHTPKSIALQGVLMPLDSHILETPLHKNPYELKYGYFGKGVELYCNEKHPIYY
jgi:hypothetical protein